MTNMLTGHTLRAIRSLRGMTQRDLAERAGISPVSLATFEAGKSDMRAGTIVKLCEALGVSIVYKIDGTEISGP
jgi:transcriptional regulator with XRE-family HTH domain